MTSKTGVSQSRSAPCRRLLARARGLYRAERLAPTDATGLDEASAVYRSSLERVAASRRWRLSAEALRRLAQLDVFTAIVVRRRADGVAVSFAGSVRHGETLQVVFVGNLDPAAHPGACDLAYLAVVEEAYAARARGNGPSRVCFGGGRTLDPADGLLRFKAKYSLGRTAPCPYLVLHHDPDAVRALMREAGALPVAAPRDPTEALHARHFPFVLAHAGTSS